MAESVYKVIELVGTSTESWEKAAVAAAENSTAPDPIDGEGISAHHAVAVDHVSELHDTRDKPT